MKRYTLIIMNGEDNTVYLKKSSDSLKGLYKTYQRETDYGHNMVSLKAYKVIDHEKNKEFPSFGVMQDYYGYDVWEKPWWEQ